MELEINSTYTVIENLVNKFVKNYCVLIDIPLNIERIVIVASGSSYNAGLFAKYFFENISEIEASVEFASEFINSKFNDYDTNALYVFVSQSGQSYDCVEAIKKVQKRGIKTLCITNNLNSYLYQNSDFKFYIDAGLEHAIAATKTFSASVFMLWLIAVKIAQNKHIDVSSDIQNIYLLANNLKEAMFDVDNIDIAAKYISKQKGFSIIGSGINYALAREAALKIKETSYINTNSCPMGEFVHGHFALLNKTKTFLTFLSEENKENEDKLLYKILNTYKKAKSIIISDSFEDYGCEILVKVPKMTSKIATLLIMIITLQLIAFKSAIFLKRNVDKPKGLNKIVQNKG